MSEKLPVAQFAPIVTRTRHGVRPATVDEAQALERREAYGIYGVLTSIESGHEIAVWRLSCADADDQRAIWRRAALALGHGAEVALYAVLVRAKGALRTSDGRAMWSLYDWDGHRLAFVWVDEDTVEAATAALCAHIWGPK